MFNSALDVTAVELNTLRQSEGCKLCHKGIDFPKGSRVYQVVWDRQPDSLWYGAFIPGDLISVERITIDANEIPKYMLYEAELIQQKSNNNSLRIQQILGQPRTVSRLSLKSHDKLKNGRSEVFQEKTRQTTIQQISHSKSSHGNTEF